MPPHSNLDMGREQSAKNDPDILEISENFQKIALLETKTEDEHCTYNIETDEEDEEEEEDEDYSDSEDDSTTNTSELKDCATIKEKGAIKSEKHNNARTNPLSRNSTSGGHCSYNNNIENAQNNNFGANPVVPVLANANNDVIAEQRQFSNFNYLQMLDLQPLIDQNDDNEINEIINEIISENSDNDDHSLDAPLLQINDNSLWFETPNNHLQLLTNPPIIENIPQTSTNLAQQALSNHIEQNKRLKLDIWVLVNTKCEDELISTLWDKITSAHFSETDLNFIYAIIFRLMKTVEGKRLLVDYFFSDVDILFNIAIKRNFLLMDFILEVYQNLGINPGMFNVLHSIVEYSHVDLCDIFDGLLNKTFDYNSSLNIFNVNWADSVGQTILMVVLKNMSMRKGLVEVNMKYLDVILRRIPDINYVSRDGRNVFYYVYNCRCPEDIILKFLNYYGPFVIDNLMKQTYNGWGLRYDTC